MMYNKIKKNNLLVENTFSKSFQYINAVRKPQVILKVMQWACCDLNASRWLPKPQGYQATPQAQDDFWLSSIRLLDLPCIDDGALLIGFG